MRVDPSLRVLLAVPDTTGGIGQHVRAVTEGLVRRGNHVTVCAPASTIERFGLASAAQNTVSLPLGRLTAVRQRRQLRALARAHDVTHAQGVRVGAQLALVGASPLVVTWHNAPLGSPARRAVHGVLERICAGRAAVVLGASDDLVARASRAGAHDARLLTVTAPEHPLSAAPVRRELHQPPVVLAVARLHPQKRLDLLVEVAARWPADSSRPQFLVAGDGPLLGTLRERARAQKAPVTFLGARDDIADLLAHADVVVLPSDWEARPLVAQEALRAGVPLVATDVGGVRGLVGAAAVLVPPGSATELAGGIRRVLEDAVLRAELQRAGPAQAARWPTADAVITELLALYAAVREGNDNS